MSLNLDAAIARGKNRREHFAKKQQHKTQIESLATKRENQYTTNNYYLFFSATNEDTHTLCMLETLKTTTIQPPTP